jgi:hypothetical protein
LHSFWCNTSKTSTVISSSRRGKVLGKFVWSVPMLV